MKTASEVVRPGCRVTCLLPRFKLAIFIRATHIMLYYNPSKGYYCQWSLAVIIWINNLVSHAQDKITSHFIANSTLLPEQKYTSSFHHCGQRWHFEGGVYYIEVFQVG